MRIVQTPAAVIEFESFGTDGTTLAIAGAITDPADAASVKTGLAFAIRRALSDAGIEPATNEHQVRLSDLEPIRQAFMAAMAERQRERETGKA